MQRFMFIPAVAMFGCLFRGVQVFCVKCQNALQFFLILFSIWRLSIIIDGCAFSDRSLGPMSIKVCCFSCLGLVWVLWVRCHHISSLHHVCGTQCIHCVRVIFSVFSLFCYVVMRENIIIIALSQQWLYVVESPNYMSWMERRDRQGCHNPPLAQQKCWPHLWMHHRGDWTVCQMVIRECNHRCNVEWGFKACSH